ncbi:adenylate/guanylate cyclase domain-containing protein [Kiloniella sp. EL199]|uniref:adenylate/guanylate cyclase domain-containing protein n=1 Tax=Kiloniella sp. EL199 TaxID=2107581 RepID=UPI000EA0DD89|nr:adenylate/guanylate cyclase domain-containing protein [Kiloniella sp. EL199]
MQRIDDRVRRGGDEDSLIGSVVDWVMAQALRDTTIEELFEGCCLRMRSAGIPIARGYIAFRTLHPLYSAMGLTWELGNGVKTVGMSHESSGSEEWRRSPFYFMLSKEIGLLRRRLVGEGAIHDFKLMEDLRDDGYTDVLCYAIHFDQESLGDTEGRGILGTWSSDIKAGLSDTDIKSLIRVQNRLAVACKVIITQQIAYNISTTYLGRNAGQRVLKGQIQRGDGEKIHAVIWYSDLRNSTALADMMPEEDYLDLLNGYFESTAGAIIDNGGDVLLLIGDAVLGIFPFTEDKTQAETGELAVKAAYDAVERIKELNACACDNGKCEASFGLGLHVGNVMFGNIGLPDRLQFTTVGPAVNEVARLEALTKDLGRRILMSKEFAEIVGRKCMPMGEHTLRGIEEVREIYTLDDEAKGMTD